jgi:hypothetical protein
VDLWCTCLDDLEEDNLPAVAMLPISSQFTEAFYFV